MDQRRRRAIAPDVFIPLAEETGLIGELGSTILKAAARTSCATRRTSSRCGVRSKAAVDAIVALGRAFGLRVFAEGVETAEQYALIRDLGCHFAQGYLLGPPGAWRTDRRARGLAAVLRVGLTRSAKQFAPIL